MGLTWEDFKEFDSKLDSIINNQTATYGRLDNLEAGQERIETSVKELSKIVKGNGSIGLDTQVALLEETKISWKDIRDKLTIPLLTGGAFFFFFELLPRIIEKLGG